ncbi:unnamed protein product, partial [Prorocentrum cordatum]
MAGLSCPAASPAWIMERHRMCGHLRGGGGFIAAPHRSAQVGVHAGSAPHLLCEISEAEFHAMLAAGLLSQPDMSGHSEPFAHAFPQGALPPEPLRQRPPAAPAEAQDAGYPLAQAAAHEHPTPAAHGQEVAHLHALAQDPMGSAAAPPPGATPGATPGAASALEPAAAAEPEAVAVPGRRRQTARARPSVWAPAAET